ncbi:MAG: hypothetical protein WC838_02105 [Candidatus Margulisiibacteriota bacterium]|jgi:hypothetical protein
MFKKTLLGISLLSILTITAFAGFDAEGGFGVVGSNDLTATNLFVRTTFKEKPWGLGVDINFVTPEDKRPADLDTFVLRYAEYDDGIWGLRLGTLESLTYGYGLVLDRYSTLTAGSTTVTNRQMGLSCYTKALPLGIYAFAARSNVYGVRFTEDFWPTMVFGKPLILGQTMVCDPDGVIVNGNVIGKGQAAIGLDAGVPIVPGLWDVYAEYGMLPDADPSDAIKGVSGMTFGTKAALSNLIQVDVRYLSFGQGFAPGYFSYQYETNPINLASTENVNSAGKNGWQASMAAALTDMLSLSATYQSFSGFDPSMTAVATGKLPNGIKGVLSYEQPKFLSLADLNANNATLKADISYPMKAGQILTVHYKRVYTGGGNYDTSTSFEYSMNFNSLSNLF